MELSILFRKEMINRDFVPLIRFFRRFSWNKSRNKEIYQTVKGSVKSIDKLYTAEEATRMMTLTIKNIRLSKLNKIESLESELNRLKNDFEKFNQEFPKID